VVAYDRLGFGRSDARHGPLTIDFVREEAETWFPLVREGLGIGEFIAMGHSVGGGMAALCAATWPEACLALVTESAQAFVEDRTLDGIREAQKAFRDAGQLERLAKYHGEKARWGPGRLDRDLALPGVPPVEPRAGPAEDHLPDARHPRRPGRVRLGGAPEAHREPGRG
jgi:pimeloyl-ACP methyl ester carboxylesterase